MAFGENALYRMCVARKRGKAQPVKRGNVRLKSEIKRDGRKKQDGSDWG